MVGLVLTYTAKIPSPAQPPTGELALFLISADRRRDVKESVKLMKAKSTERGERRR